MQLVSLQGTRALSCSLTEDFQSDDFVLAQPLAGLVVRKAPRVEQPTFDTFPEAQRDSISWVVLRISDIHSTTLTVKELYRNDCH